MYNDYMNSKCWNMVLLRCCKYCSGQWSISKSCVA